MALNRTGEGTGLPYMSGLQGLLFVLSLVGFFGYLLHVREVLTYPHEVEVWEGNEYVAAMRMASGHPPYGWPSGPDYPSSFYPYGPLQPAITAVALHLVHRAVGESACTPAVGRFVSVLAGMLTAMLIGLVVYGRTRNRLAAATSGMAFLSLAPYLRFLTVGRADSLGLLLVIACLAASESRLRRVRLLGVTAGALSAFTKQNFVVLCLPAVAHIFRRERREGFVALGLLVGVVLIGGLATQIWSGGAFWHNIVTYQSHAKGDYLDAETLAISERAVYLLGWWLRFAVLNLGVQVLAVWYLFRGARRRELGPWVGAYWLALVLSLLAYLQWGASVNRMNPAIAVGLVLFGLALAEIRAAMPGSRMERAFLSGAVLLVGVHLVIKSPFMELPSFLPGYDEAMNRVAATVRTAPGPVMSERAISAVYRARSDALVGFTLAKPRLSPHADDQIQALLQDIARERFAAVVLVTGSPFLPVDISDAVDSRYALALDLPRFNLKVYTRKPGGSAELSPERRAEIAREEQEYRKRTQTGWNLFQARKDGDRDNADL